MMVVRLLRSSRMALKKVSMALTEWDIKNAETLVERLHARNKAAAVSSALAITESLTRRVQDGGELMIKRKDGTMESVVIAGM